MPSGLSLPEILELVPEGGAMVATLVTPQGSAAFVLPAGLSEVTDAHILALDGLDDTEVSAWLEGTAADPGWLRMVFDMGVADRQGALVDRAEAFTARLWPLLMGRIHDHLVHLGLREGATILLMAQGRLGLVPLHAAWREVDGAKRAFLDDWTVVHMPSAYALAAGRRRLRDPRRHRQSLLAVIDPTDDLRFARLEGEEVATLFDPGARDALVGADASREDVIARSAGSAYVHFACHGTYDWRDVTRSALLLAGSEPLTLGEIVSPGFELSATRLVTLSACATGLTAYRTSPDEYIGLPAGFLEAGAPAVISSLWAVDDLSTGLLMREFYRGHLHDGLAPAIALRSAQLWLRSATAERLGLAGLWRRIYEDSGQRDVHAFRAMRYFQAQPAATPFANPYFWAGFTMSGADA
jgi:CHAT domain-containing protein